MKQICFLFLFTSLTLAAASSGQDELKSESGDATTKNIRRKFKNCGEVQRWAERAAGVKSVADLSEVQKIFPSESSEGVRVLCDFTTEGGGWTVLQNRGPGPREEFYREWDEYEKGFGKPRKNHWVGLENMYQLSSLNNLNYSNNLNNLNVDFTGIWTITRGLTATETASSGIIFTGRSTHSNTHK